MRGALTPLLTVWCTGTGKLEVFRHDVNEYRSVSAYARSTLRVWYFRLDFQTMTAKRVFPWMNCDTYLGKCRSDSDKGNPDNQSRVAYLKHLLRPTSYASPPDLPNTTGVPSLEHSRTTLVISSCKKVCTLSTRSEAIFHFRIQPKLFPMPRKHKRWKVAVLDLRSIWRLFVVLTRRNRMFSVVFKGT